MNLLMAMLGMALLGLVASNLMHRQSLAFSASIYQAELVEAASQEGSFARAVAKYVAANSVSAGMTIAAAQLIAAGDLAPGFPAVNPFGQTPVALAGINDAVLVTYTGGPVAAAVAVSIVNVNSAISLEAMAMTLASDVAAMQGGLPQLTGGMLENGVLTTPMGGTTVSAANDFPGVVLPSGPIFVDMLNVLPVATYNSNTGYGTTTGD